MCPSATLTTIGMITETRARRQRDEPIGTAQPPSKLGSATANPRSQFRRVVEFESDELTVMT